MILRRGDSGFFLFLRFLDAAIYYNASLMIANNLPLGSQECSQ